MRKQIIPIAFSFFVLAAVIYFHARGDEQQKRKHLLRSSSMTTAPIPEPGDAPQPDPAPSPVTPPPMDPSVNAPDVEIPSSPAAEAVEKELSEYRRMHNEGAEPEEFARQEAVIREKLAALSPDEALDFLVNADAPIVTHLMLGWIDENLARDRARWEEALRKAVETASADLDRMSEIAEFAVDRIESPERRAEAARFLMFHAPEDRQLLLVARFADADAREEIRSFLWSRTPQDGAIEGLGYVVLPQEVTRLELIEENRDAVERALDIAYERTQDNTFQISLTRIRR